MLLLLLLLLLRLRRRVKLRAHALGHDPQVLWQPLNVDRQQQVAPVPVHFIQLFTNLANLVGEFAREALGLHLLVQLLHGAAKVGDMLRGLHVLVLLVLWQGSKRVLDVFSLLLLEPQLYLLRRQLLALWRRLLRRSCSTCSCRAALGYGCTLMRCK